MSLSKKQMVCSKNIASLIVYADLIGIDLTFGDAFRNDFTQREYVRKGLSKTMNSYHRKRLAVDFNFFINGKLTYNFEDVKELGEFWLTLHPKNRWGGDFNKNGVKDGFVDTPHFEMQE
jgi:hypothetical protein